MVVEDFESGQIVQPTILKKVVKVDGPGHLEWNNHRWRLTYNYLRLVISVRERSHECCQTIPPNASGVVVPSVSDVAPAKSSAGTWLSGPMYQSSRYVSSNSRLVPVQYPNICAREGTKRMALTRTTAPPVPVSATVGQRETPKNAAIVVPTYPLPMTVIRIE
ncbi:hypothetical protein ACFOZ7_12465 [Natribaculum luteum]|uniref:Uncharacterized protein n=1 Tax=Natribaculum luteum TaxID=1586232 RepID=A0ABD5P160_9EURY|nr:hypothetical protein [Natribaculum luteum]